MSDWHVLPDDGNAGEDFDAYPEPGVLVWIHEVFYSEGEATVGFVTRYSSGRYGWRSHDGSDDVGVRAWAPMERPEVPRA